MQHTPQRMCIACREMKDKRQLVRVVKSPEGDVAPDLTGKAQGRGAYTCKTVACIAKAQKIRALERVFKMKIDKEVYDALFVLAEDGESGV